MIRSAPRFLAIERTARVTMRVVMLSKQQRDLLLICILVSCLAGAGMSGQLVKLHDGARSTDTNDPGLFARLCRSVAGGESGCEGTVHSVWSQIPLPLPVRNGGLTVSLRRV